MRHGSRDLTPLIVALPSQVLQESVDGRLGHDSSKASRSDGAVCPALQKRLKNIDGKVEDSKI